MARHPGGSWLINLAIGRDCTALFESYHLRPEVSGVHRGERGLCCFKLRALRWIHSPAASGVRCVVVEGWGQQLLAFSR
eukprot:scaffold14011_cov20-Tisochrysis_lutea.AAC.3